MIRHILSICAIFACSICLTGCGGSGGGAYDADNAPPQDQAQIDEAAAYTAEMAGQAEPSPSGTTSPGN